MNIKTLNQIAISMVADSKGILALDESHGTIQKRFDSLGIEVNEENRRSYRDMLINSEILSQIMCLELYCLMKQSGKKPP